MINKIKYYDRTYLKKEVLSIGKNSLIYVVGKALSQAVGFFMIPVYTRFIMPGNYGAMEMIEIIASIIGMIVAVGVGDSMSRFYYAEKEIKKQNEIVSTIIVGFGALAIPIVLIFMSLSGILSFIVLEAPEYRFYLQLAIATIWFSMQCEIGFTYLRMRYLAKLFITVTTCQLLLALSLNIWFVVFLKLGILGIFYSTLITQSLTALILCSIILRKVGLHVSFLMLRKLVGFGLPLIPSRISRFLGFVSNRFFLRWIGSPDPAVALTMVGLFSLGNKFGVIVSRFVNAPFNSFWGPRRMELLLSEDPRAPKTLSRICTYATLLSIYVALGISVGIESLIDIVADPKYQGAHVVVPFVALSYVILALDWHFSISIIYTRHTIWSTYTGLLSLAVMISWNYFFVPRYGLIGAATSNLAGFLAQAIANYFISQKLFPIPFEIGRISIMIVVAVALYGVSQYINFASPWYSFLARTMVAAFFPLTLFLVGFYKKEELVFFSSIKNKFLPERT